MLGSCKCDVVVIIVILVVVGVTAVVDDATFVLDVAVDVLVG